MIFSKEADTSKGWSGGIYDASPPAMLTGVINAATPSLLGYFKYLVKVHNCAPTVLQRYDES